MEIILTHNHQSYEDFAVEKVIIVESKVYYQRLLKEFLIKNYNLYIHNNIQRDGTNSPQYIWLTEEESKSERYKYLFPLIRLKGAVPEKALNTAWVDRDLWYKYLEEHNCLIFDPVYSN